MVPPFQPLQLWLKDESLEDIDSFYVVDCEQGVAHDHVINPRVKARYFDVVCPDGCRGFGRSFQSTKKLRKKPSMKLPIAALVAFTGFSLCAASVASAADESFVGKWKMNPDKSQFNGLTYKVEDAGGGNYRFVFGDDVETLSLDGKEHVTKFGETWSITKTGPNAWKWTSKKDGKVTSDAMWTVSEDGKTSVYTSDNKRPDGTTSHDEQNLTRTEGSTGLVGTWQTAGLKIGSVGSMEIQKWQGDGYTISNTAYKSQTDFKLDGKDYTPKGPRVAEGTTLSAKAIDAHKIELAYKFKGKGTETDRWELSADGKTLTNTITYAGVNKPEVDVFDRQ